MASDEKAAGGTGNIASGEGGAVAGNNIGNNKGGNDDRAGRDHVSVFFFFVSVLNGTMNQFFRF